MNNARYNTERPYKPNPVPKFELEQKFTIDKSAKSIDNRKKVRDVFAGKVIDVSRAHVTLQNKNGVKESFRFLDFMTGDIAVL